MQVARLYQAKDIRIEDSPNPPAPKADEILLNIKAVGLCGSDLHMYESGRIGYTDIQKPFILGHEFMGEIVAVGSSAIDGNHQPLKVGQRVAVEPAVPCWHCELCEQGHPNLCPNHYFYGLFPDDGALREQMIVSARNCFPIPDSISDGAGALLETLGVAIHAVDLGKVKVANSVAVIGCGPVGLLIIKLLKLAGADPIFAFDKLDWRVEKAKQWGASHAFQVQGNEAVDIVQDLSDKRGVDVAFEAAWADHSVQQAADMARYGGRLVLVGIPGDDKLQMTHSVARRKGLTIMMSRRMKHTYPRAIHLSTSGKVDLDDLVSHTFPLSETATAYAKNFAYDTGINKVVLTIP